jgi:hypothetical protein
MSLTTITDPLDDERQGKEFERIERVARGFLEGGAAPGEQWQALCRKQYLANFPDSHLL